MFLPRRPVLIPLLLLGLLVAACGPMTPYPTAAVARPDVTPSPLATLRPTPSPTVAASPTLISSAADAALATVEQQVALLMGVSNPPPVRRVALTPLQLSNRAARLAPTPPVPDLTLWRALDLLPADGQPDGFFPAPPEHRVAFFAPAENTIFFTAEGLPESALQQAYAHAYAHALLFHAHALPPCGDDEDRCATYWALREGYATYAEYLWFSAFAPARPSPVAPSPLPPPAAAPPAAVQWQQFPVVWGLRFLFQRQQEGGAALLHQALAQPPATTVEVMFPERRFAESPQEVTLPAGATLEEALGATWQEQGRGDFGAWPLYLMLTASAQTEARLPADDAAAAVAGWAGGAWASLLDASGQAAMLADLRWRDNDSTVAFVKAFALYARGVYGPLNDRAYRILVWVGDRGAAVLYYNVGAQRTVWAVAPTRAQAETLLRAADIPQFR